MELRWDLNQLSWTNKELLVGPGLIPFVAKSEVFSAVDPATAKLTPWLKLPSFLRYGSSNGNL